MSGSRDMPVRVLQGDLSSEFLFVCEHASAHIPKQFHDLGLDETARFSHIAWDPGAEMVTRHLCAHFDAPAVISQVSRLVYDCNRPPGAADAIPSRSEVFDIPGNQELSAEQINERIETYYLPFERTVSEVVDRHNSRPALITIHSFTRVFDGEDRQTQLGILHDNDSRFADAILALAPQHTALNVQRNQPYGPEDGVTHTLKVHAQKRGLLNAMIEVRNDLVQTPEQCATMAGMLAGLLEQAVHKYRDDGEKKRASA